MTSPHPTAPRTVMLADGRVWTFEPMYDGDGSPWWHDTNDSYNTRLHSDLPTAPLTDADRSAIEAAMSNPTAPAEGRTPLPPHEPDWGRTGHPKHWCERCRLEAASASETPAPTAPSDEEFTEWLAREVPPATVISDPRWWARKILRRLRAAPPAAPAPTWERVSNAVLEAMRSEPTGHANSMAQVVAITNAMLKLFAAPAAPAAAIREFPQPERCDLCGEVFPEGDAHDCAARPESEERT